MEDFHHRKPNVCGFRELKTLQLSPRRGFEAKIMKYRKKKVLLKKISKMENPFYTK